jgi:hypothetical protein
MYGLNSVDTGLDWTTGFNDDDDDDDDDDDGSTVSTKAGDI